MFTLHFLFKENMIFVDIDIFILLFIGLISTKTTTERRNGDTLIDVMILLTHSFKTKVEKISNKH